MTLFLFGLAIFLLLVYLCIRDMDREITTLRSGTLWALTGFWAYGLLDILVRAI